MTTMQYCSGIGLIDFSWLKEKKEKSETRQYKDKGIQPYQKNNLPNKDH